jgi:beta-lactamase class A
MKAYVQKHSRAVFAMGFIAVFLGGLFVGKMTTQPVIIRNTTLREAGYHYINPILLCNVNPPDEVNEDKALTSKIRSVINQSQNSANDISAYVLQFKVGKWAGVDINEQYSPASMLKVPTMMAILKYTETHEGFLSKQIYFDGSFDDNTAQNYRPADFIKAKHTYTIDQLLTYMIVYSDNNATRLLNGVIDQSSLTELYIDLGIQLPAASVDFMSTKTYAMFLRILYGSTYLTREMSEKALKLLSANDFPQGLYAGVPQGVEIAQKYGERQVFNPDGTLFQRELHDCGIVYAPTGPYVLCVMTRGEDFGQMSTLIQKISKVVYDYTSQLSPAGN